MRILTFLIVACALAMLPGSLANAATAAAAAMPTKGGAVTKHELAPLPYAYNALEPYYDEATVRLHHDKHQMAYVNGLNKAEEELAKARESGDYSVIGYWERQLAFNGAGDALHTMLWHNMAPNAGGEPTGDLMNLIKRDFGSFDNFKQQFTAAAIGIEASGWAVLGWQPQYQKLYIYTIENHQKQLIAGMQPLLVLDMWEHAYYLKHQNRRPEWVENWWRIVNWPDVSKRISGAMR